MPDYIFLNKAGQTLDNTDLAGPTQARSYAATLAIQHRTAVTVAEVIEYRIQPACMFCAQPATIQASDWDLCDDHYNTITEPWPGVDEVEADELAG